MNGFIGEFLILMGAFAVPGSPPSARRASSCRPPMLWMFQRVNYGEVTNEKNRALPDLTGREWAMMIPTVAMCIFMGVAPAIFLRPMERSVARVIDLIHGVGR